MDQKRKNPTLYKKFKTKCPVLAQTIKPVRKGLKLTAKTTAKVAMIATPVVPYLPLIGAAVGAGVGIVDSSSILSLTLPSLTDVVLPAALGGVIGHHTKEAIKHIAEEGISNPVALAEVGVGALSLAGNLILNPTPTPINTIAVVGGSMAATSVAKHYGVKKQISIKELADKQKKLNKDAKKVNKERSKMLKNFDDFNKSEVNFCGEDSTISWELKEVYAGRKAKAKWLQEQIDKNQVPDINRGI